MAPCPIRTEAEPSGYRGFLLLQERLQDIKRRLEATKRESEIRPPLQIPEKLELSDSGIIRFSSRDEGRAAPIETTVELRHHLLLRNEACFGHQLKSYELGCQDLIYPDWEYQREVPSEGNQRIDTKKLQHPLYGILERNVKEKPLHSNW